MNFETNNLIIREFKSEDLQSVHIYSSDKETTEFMDWGPNSENETQAFINEMLEEQNLNTRKFYVFGITLKNTDSVIGSIGLEIQSLENKNASFGYILNKHFWNRGIVTEASECILNFGFNDLELHRIWATCRPENTKSIYLLKKLGFKKEGHLKDDKLIHGIFRDSVLFAKIKQDRRNLILS